jgi:hypothetical protein
MTDQRIPGQSAVAVSPYLSLRQAVRPLIFARALLASRQPLAGQLAEECERLSRLTREALEAAALVHLLSPEAGDVEAAGDTRGRHAALIDAYGRAGAAWAEVVGTAVALGGALLESERVDDARRLADFLGAAGEPAAAKDLGSRADTATRRALEARLTRIHTAMSESEIDAAIEALRESREDAIIAFYIRSVAESMVGCLPEEAPVSDFGANNWELRNWLIKPGEVIAETTNLFSYRYATSPERYQFWPNHLRAPVKITKLLVPEGAKLAGKIMLISVVRLPDKITKEIGMNAARPVGALGRLDAIAWEFRQQMETVRKRAGGA